MKLKSLINEITELLKPLEVKKEYRTSDGTRIDLAIPEKGLAIEFENSYKWIDRRVLYNAIKAHREGFKDLIIIYPFKDDVIQRSWIIKCIKELGVNLKIIKPDELNKILKITK